jgi:hypothetical protein
MDANATKIMLRRLLRFGVSDGASSGDSGAMGELEMELALLREENARLKVERHRAPDAGRIIDRMRHLGEEPTGESLTGNGSQGNGNGSDADESARALSECLAIRNALLQTCQEVQQAMHGIRSRLGEISLEVQDRSGDPAPADPIAAAKAAEADLELAVGARAPSDLSQNAA